MEVRAELPSSPWIRASRLREDRFDAFELFTVPGESNSFCSTVTASSISPSAVPLPDCTTYEYTKDHRIVEVGAEFKGQEKKNTHELFPQPHETSPAPKSARGKGKVVSRKVTTTAKETASRRARKDGPREGEGEEKQARRPEAPSSKLGLAADQSGTGAHIELQLLPVRI